MNEKLNNRSSNFSSQALEKLSFASHESPGLRLATPFVKTLARTERKVDCGLFTFESPSNSVLQLKDLQMQDSKGSEMIADRPWYERLNSLSWGLADVDAFVFTPKNIKLGQSFNLSSYGKPIIKFDPCNLSHGNMAAVPEQQKTQKKFKKGVGCCCQKTKCLRLHCKCFRSLGFCGKDCGCSECFNTLQYQNERKFVIEKTKKIFSGAFKNKIVFSMESVGLNSHGCLCKTGCSKKYCDCYRNKVPCSPMCKCKNCCNTRVEIASDEVRLQYQSTRRKKDKLCIKIRPKCPPEAEKDPPSAVEPFRSNEQDSACCSVTFQPYHKKPPEQIKFSKI